jgi:hypothetical protein
MYSKLKPSDSLSLFEFLNIFKKNLVLITDYRKNNNLTLNKTIQRLDRIDKAFIDIFLHLTSNVPLN